MISRFFVYLFLFYPYILIQASPFTLINPKANWTLFFQKIKQESKINTFIETGTYLGDTTAIAARYFDTIYTIEALPLFYNQALERFKDTPNITVFLGDSGKIFPTLLPSISQNNYQPLFWLDGHVMSALSEDEEEFQHMDYTPIVKELIEIKNNNLPTGIILIDDIRLFGTELHNERLPLAGKIEYPLITDVPHLLGSAYEYKIFGDILIAHTKDISISFSPLIEACTISRMFNEKNYSVEEVLEAEQIIKMAEDEELESIRALHHDFASPWKRQWSNKSPHYNLWYGLTLQNKNDHTGAIEQFKEVLGLGYDHWRVLWYLAQSLHAINEISSCQAILELISKTNPEFIPAHDLLNALDLLNNLI